MDNWLAHYAVQPFGDEQYLLARACSLLYLLVHVHYKENTFDAMEDLTRLFMPPEWIDKAKSTSSVERKLDFESVTAFEKMVSNGNVD